MGTPPPPSGHPTSAEWALLTVARILNPMSDRALTRGLTSLLSTPAGRAVAATAGTGAAGLFYATVIERNAFALRHVTMPVLEPGSTPLRVLHISDLHMMPNQYLKQAWVSELAALEPDLVVNTGDNLAHPSSVPAVIQALDGLLTHPGLFVFGSNDYFGPTPKNPFTYFNSDHERQHGEPLPWRDLRAAFIERGWLDATHRTHEIEIGGTRIVAAGVDDPHLDRDRYDTIAGRPNPLAQLRLGLTHSPEPRVLDHFADDGYDLVMAGHTHGGQLCLPFIGALVTNCELDRSRVKGPSRWGNHLRLHVSAGLGTSPYAPARFMCRPEATLLTLTPVSHGDAAATTVESLPQMAEDRV
ncbi:metallophosphoesterase [Gordonia defluvii]|uniref:Metallophosphoesterase n=2 Tax=Gordoniaceae TaxID=85026 RepID=A0ABP6LKG0_9ACTN